MLCHNQNLAMPRHLVTRSFDGAWVFRAPGQVPNDCRCAECHRARIKSIYEHAERENPYLRAQAKGALPGGAI